MDASVNRDLEEGEVASEDFSFAGLSAKVKKGKIKKLKKKISNGHDVPMDVYYEIFGKNAVASVESRMTSNKSLSARDLQDLILWTTADGKNPSWVLVKNRPLISKIVFLMINDMNGPFVKSHKEECDPIKTLFPVHANIQCPGSNVSAFSLMNSVINMPVCLLHDKVKENEAAASASRSKEANLGGEGHTMASFIATQKELEDHDYPQSAMLGEDSDWFMLPAADPANPKEKCLAIDCEMVKTAGDLSELARLTVVTESLEVLLDVLVLPEQPVIDYLTKYSGITPELLEGVKTCLKDVQVRLCELCDQNTIFVGHSLENDFRALKLVHFQVIDTSLIYQSKRGVGFKPALRHLTLKHLNRTIQDAGGNGHDSVADARASMGLLHMKVLHGPSFGQEVKETVHLLDYLEERGTACCMIDNAGLCKAMGGSLCDVVPVATDEDAVKKAVQVLKSKHVVWVQLHDLKEKGAESFGEVQSNVQTLLSQLPNNTFVMLLGARNDISTIRRKQEAKAANPDSQQVLEELKQAVKTVRDAVCYVTVKHPPTENVAKDDTAVEIE
jgi:RNA exonuclease 1